MVETPVQRIRVGVADMAVTTDADLLVTSGLGSCVAVAVHDGNGVGGLLHAMLPTAPEHVDRPPKYVDTGLDAMVTELSSLGADPDGLSAKLAGGASMLDLGNGSPVGTKNVAAAREALSARDIAVVAAETGGDAGRSVTFDPSTGVVTIKRVDSEEETL
ncbi:MAG: chemotaxis protein CheD [archaeon]